MKVQGLNVYVTVGDVTLIGADGGASLVDCIIHESIEQPIPTCVLSFDAGDTFLKDHPIADGTLITIHLFTDDGDLDEYYDFRVYNLELEIMSYFIRYKVACFLDVYSLFLGAEPYIANTYSSQIFKSVASKLKLKENIDTTLDKQLWVPSNLDVACWLSNISRYGYIDNLSCMVWGLEKNKTLLYKNLSSIIKSTPRTNLMKLVPTNNNQVSEPNTLPYNSAQPVFDSGYENLKYAGYGGYNTYFDFLSYSAKKASANKVVASSNMLNINKELSQGLNPNNLAFNVGNFHDHYYEAYMQNLRQLSTYSTYMSVLLETWSPNLRLLTPVVLEYSVSGMTGSNAEGSRIDSLSNVYVISKVSTVINAGLISQGLHLMGQGYNTDNSTGTY